MHDEKQILRNNYFLLHLTSGRGPAECELAVGLFKSFLEKTLKVEILSEEKGRFKGCFKSALLRVSNAGETLFGTVQWICKSPFRPNHKRKNWFIKVKKIEEPINSVYEIGKPGVIFQTFRSSGKGGQYVNKTESAVRVIHIETGITAIASDERSQYQNKKLAMERLKVLLEKNNNEAQIKSNRELFMNHNTLERGNPIWIYEGISFQRVDKG